MNQQPLCPYCHRPMQQTAQYFHEKTGELISTHYLCACRGAVYYKNDYVVKDKR